MPNNIPIQDRRARLRNFKTTPTGFVWMARCQCGHLAPLPVVSLLKRFGELYPVDMALLRVVCTGCGKGGLAEAKLLRLCDPGCGRYRG